MSAIDRFENVHVGEFHGISVYWLDEIVAKNDLLEIFDSKEFQSIEEILGHTKKEIVNPIGKGYLLIGGGSGEHPILIINNDAAVLKVLQDLEDFKDSSSSAEQVNYVDKVEKILDEMFYSNDELWYWKFDANQWNIEDFVASYEELNKYDLLDSRCLYNDTVLKIIGVFILRYLPLDVCLTNEKIKKLAKEYKEEYYDQDLLAKYFEVIKVPTPEEQCGNRHVENSSVWHYSLEEWKNKNKIF